ncbi:HIT domain-containing protein [Streptomyces sp. NPDC046985]|uniref:HIT domain-containing protein n=1 Tax=Streptomyces sp. NPDC046985 TaxID=3155377 RepID=UPI0033EBA804
MPTELVVVPKRHIPSLVDLGEGNEEILADVLRVVRSVAAQVREEHGAACVVTNEHQESKHMHSRQSPDLQSRLEKAQFPL